MTAPTRAAVIRALIVIAALAAAAVFGLVWTRPPAPSPTADFDIPRALADLAVIARRPHPMGSEEHAAVRAYLVDQLRAMGLAPEVHESVVTDGRRNPTRFATVKNVVARIKGTRGEGKALLLMAHYDSRSTTPGAADDSTGVVALLGTARAIVAGPPLASDVMLVFSDGEEVGLLGARAFVGGDRWAADVGVVLNFEARGDRGAALMFQTSQGNGALIRELAGAATRVAASSLLADVYRKMPNDTDLSVWLARPPPTVQAMNFANIGGFERYHAPTDTVENLSQGTLAQQGAYALSLARALGARALPLPPEPDAAFFCVGPFFVHYPGALTLPLAAAALILLVLFCALGRREGVLGAGGIAIAFAAAIGAVVAGGALAFAALRLASVVRGGVIAQTAASPGMKDFFFASFALLGAAAAIATLAALSRLRAAEVFAGAALLWVVNGLLAAVYLPGGAFLVTWPATSALLGGIALVRAGLFESDAPLAAAIAALAAVPAIVVTGPYVVMFGTTFGLMAAPMMGAVTASIVVLAAPAMRVVLGAGRRAVPLAALALALGAFALGSTRAAWSPRYPRPDTLIYAIDHDALKSAWMSTDAATDAFTAPVLEAAKKEKEAPLPFPLHGDRPLLVADAKTAPEPAPEIVWGEETAKGEGRAIRIRVVPPRGADLMAIQVDRGVASAEVQGKPAQLEGSRLSFLYSAPPEGGVELDLVTTSREPVTVRALSARPGFPEGVAPPPRPVTYMARPGLTAPREELFDSDATLVAVSATR